MSNTGFSGFSPGFRSGGAGSETSPLSSLHPIKLVDPPAGLRQNLQTLRETIKLRGEVIRENADKSIKVRTPKGDIDVRVSDDARGKRPEPGARVEIEIRPARQADTQRASTKPTEPTASLKITRPAPAPLEEAANKNPALRPQRPQQYSASPAPSRAAVPPNGLPPEGAIIRLTPLSPGTSFIPAPPTDTLNQIIKIPPQLPVITDIKSPESYSLFFQPRAQTDITPLIKPENPFTPPTHNAAPASTLPSASITAPPTQPPLSGSIDTKTETPTFLAPSQDSHVKIDRIHPPQISITASETPSTLITNNQSAHSLTAIVSNINTETLQPIITLFFPHDGQAQHFTLQSRTNAEQLTIGTRLELTPQTFSSTTTAATAQPIALPPLPFLAQSGPWPAMEELQQTLTRIAPQAAQAMNALTPSPSAPAQMGPAMMFFVAAIRGGDLGAWLGEKALDALQKSGSKQLTRFLQEGQALSRIAGDSSGQDWRIAHIPLAWEGQIQKASIYYKHERSDDEETSGGTSGTRFVFDLALDTMGKVQLDGLYRPISADGKRLDLALRTENSFSEATKAEMRRVYASALKDTDVSGSLDFQGRGDGWVTVNIEDDKDELEVRV